MPSLPPKTPYRLHIIPKSGQNNTQGAIVDGHTDDSTTTALTVKMDPALTSPGEYLVLIEVNGTFSELQTDTSTSPATYSGPTVSIP